MIGATVGVDDGFAVLGLATVGDDRDRCGDAERGKRAFEAAVRLNGEICDGGHVISPESSGPIPDGAQGRDRERSEEHTSELQSLMRISYAVFCLKKKKHYTTYERHPS